MEPVFSSHIVGDGKKWLFFLSAGSWLFTKWHLGGKKSLFGCRWHSFLFWDGHKTRHTKLFRQTKSEGTEKYSAKYNRGVPPCPLPLGFK